MSITATVDKTELETVTTHLPTLVEMPEGDERDAKVAQIMATIDMENTTALVSFGSNAQSDLQALSQSMLDGVRNKDVGPAGDALTSMVTTLRGFDVSADDGRSKRTWWEKLLGRAAPMAKLMARFETVRGQIDKITDNLLSHETTLMRDIKMLDKLYEKTLDFYKELGLYILAAERKLEELDTVTIPQLAKDAEAADESDQILKAQKLRDMRAARDDLERRLHDLKLTRQVTMQSLPSIRLVQENDKSLVGKIGSTLNNTVPLWETQLAQALTIQRSREAAEAVKGANDLTNELLTANATNLREANKVVRTEMERGVFDIEAVKMANNELIATIEESLSITQEGKAKRAAAEEEMKQMEATLRETLAKAKAAPKPVK